MRSAQFTPLQASDRVYLLATKIIPVQIKLIQRIVFSKTAKNQPHIKMGPTTLTPGETFSIFENTFKKFYLHTGVIFMTF